MENGRIVVAVRPAMQSVRSVRSGCSQTGRAFYIPLLINKNVFAVINVLGSVPFRQIRQKRGILWRRGWEELWKSLWYMQ